MTAVEAARESMTKIRDGWNELAGFIEKLGPDVAAADPLVTKLAGVVGVISPTARAVIDGIVDLAAAATRAAPEPAAGPVPAPAEPAEVAVAPV